ncbi:hypothetical protein D3C76_702050 [compost metagenome]
MQLSRLGTLDDDSSIMRDVCRAGDVAHQLGGIDDCHLAARQRMAHIGQSDAVRPDHLRVAAEDHAVQRGVIFRAEVFRRQEGADFLATRRLVHQAAEYTVFRFNRNQWSFHHISRSSNLMAFLGFVTKSKSARQPLSFWPIQCLLVRQSLK